MFSFDVIQNVRDISIMKKRDLKENSRLLERNGNMNLERTDKNQILSYN